MTADNTTPNQPQGEEPELRRVDVWICAPCLDGEEGECHSPGCAFFICPAPTAEQAERLKFHIASPVGMRPDGTADERVEAGAEALQVLGVAKRRSWDYSDAVLRAAIDDVVEVQR